MFSLAQFSEYARFFAQFLETSDSAFNRFVFSNSNTGHKLTSPPIHSGPN